MRRRETGRVGALLGGARLAVGLSFLLAPRALGRALVGTDADTPGARLFVRGFGARDMVLGAGALRARRSTETRAWLAAAGMADAIDAATTVVGRPRLTGRRRAIAFVVSALPAAANLGAAHRLDGEGSPPSPARWMYARGRPNRLARALNRGWQAVASRGLGPRRLAAVEVAGRRSGRPRAFPAVVADHEGERYLVSMLGESADWVANVRAAEGQAVLRRGRPERVRLEEVEPGGRASILRRYLEVAPGARAHIPVGRDASLIDLEAVARDHPVFRVCPEPDRRPTGSPDGA